MIAVRLFVPVLGLDSRVSVPLSVALSGVTVNQEASLLVAFQSTFEYTDTVAMDGAAIESHVVELKSRIVAICPC